MAVGKNISVVLSLTDDGFSSKSRNAAEAVKALSAGVSEAANKTVALEGAITGLSGDLKQFARGFEGMQRTLQSTTEGLKQFVLGMRDVSSTQRQATRDVKENTNAVIAAIDAKKKALAGEIESNKSIMATRKATHDAYVRQLQEEKAKSEAAFARAGDAEKRLGPFAGKNVIAQNMGEATRHEQNAAAIQTEINAINRWVDAYRKSQAARISGIASLDAERAAELRNIVAKERRAAIEAAVGKNNAEEMSRIRKAAAERDAELIKGQTAAEANAAKLRRDLKLQEVESDRQAEQMKREQVRETEQARKLAAQRALENERSAANATSQMWKGMAQAYAGAKIEKGLGASVHQADEMEREKVTVSALNLPGAEQAALIGDAEQMSKSLKFITVLDSIKSRMSAIASIGSNNTEIINSTLTTAVKAANNLQQLHMAEGDTQQTIRNLYGVVEMRQQTGDATKTNETFEMMQKIITGTAGKVQTQDMETVLRRLGMGASQLSNDGMINLAAVVDQFKVAGGGGGGAGGGVSTVGTAFKMMQAYSLGKGISNTAVKEFSGAGILNEAGLDMSKDDAHILSDSKHVGFKDADLWLKDPVAAVQKIMPQIVEYTKSDKQKSKYYGDRDTNDTENQMVAVSMYLARLGITTTASQALMVAGDPRSKKRIGEQAETIKNSKGIDGVDADLAKTYARDLQEVKVELTNISALVGAALLPPLKEVLIAFRGILEVVQDVVKSDFGSLLTPLTAIGAALGGVLLSGAGFMKLFGVTGITGLLEMVGGGAIVAGSGMGILAAGARLVFGVFTSLLGVLVAFDMGYIVGTWISKWNVGGITVAEDFENMVTRMETFFKKFVINLQVMWANFRSTWGFDDADAAAIRRKALNTRLDEADRYQDVLLNKAPVVDAAAKKRDVDRKLANDKDTRPLAEVAKQDRLDKIDADAKAQAAATKKRLGAGGGGGGNRVADAADAGSKGKGKGGRGKDESNDRDPLNAALETANGKVESQQEKLRALVSGGQTLESLRQEAYDLIEGKRKANDYSKNRLEKFKPDFNDKSIVALKEKTFQEMLMAEQIKGITFANERVAASTYEADSAMERITSGGIAKQTDAFKALNRELIRAEQRLGVGTTGFNEWSKAKANALYQQARADANNFAAKYVDKNAADGSKLLPTERGRIEAELSAARNKEDQEYQITVDTLKKQTAARADAAMRDGGNLETRIAHIQQIEAEAQRDLDRNEQIYSERRKIRAEEEIRQKETALQKMTREWADYGKAVENIESKAADGFVSMLTDSLGTGKMEVGKFVKSILTDLASAKLKETLAQPLKEFVSKGGDWVKSSIFGAKSSSAINDGSENVAELAKLGRQAGLSGDALQKFVTEGVQKAAVATAGQAADTLKSASVTNVFTGSIEQATLALEAMISSMAAGGGASSGIGGTLSKFFGGGGSGGAAGPGMLAGETGGMDLIEAMPWMFADGGVMTSVGPVQLRKYATGGIANSPQLALYGEAGPEAYVPLPDGRSIPVTMSGGQGGAPAVTVNVINQTSQSVNAEQGGMRFDGKAYILDVVMTAAAMPGGFRNGLKEAVR